MGKLGGYLMARGFKCQGNPEPSRSAFIAFPVMSIEPLKDRVKFCLLSPRHPSQANKTEKVNLSNMMTLQGPSLIRI